MTAQGSVEVGGRLRTYSVVGRAREAAEAAGARDLVLVFHGSKQDGAKHRRFTGRAFDALTESGRVVVAYLDGYRGNWNDARRGSGFPARLEDVDDVGFARAVVERLVETHAVGGDRVFAVGYSNGGQMVIRLLHEAPGMLAGAAVIAATMPAPENFLLPDAVPAALPVLLVHGTKDPIAAYGGGELGWVLRRVFQVEGRTLSAPETAAYFAAHNGITAEPTTTPVPVAKGPGVKRTEYRQDGRPPVILCTVVGGGHTVPGPGRAPFVVGRSTHEVDAADLVAEHLGLRR
jgi:polyhydroxybutyrate depolymerase